MTVSSASSNEDDAGSDDDRDPRHHHLVQAPVAELDDRVDHLLLLGLEDALLAAALHDQPQLLGGDLGLGRDLGAEQPGDPARDRRSGRDDAARAAGRGSRAGPTARARTARCWRGRATSGTSSANTIVNRARITVTTTSATKLAVPRSMPAPASASARPSARLTAANAEARKPMTVRPSCDDGEEPARVVEQAAHPPGARACPPRPAARRGCAGSTRARSRRRRRSPRGS